MIKFKELEKKLKNYDGPLNRMWHTALKVTMILLTQARDLTAPAGV